MSLLLTERNVISKLPEHYQPIVLAKFSEPIKKMGNLSLATEIRNMVVIAHAELGLNIDSKDDVISFMVDTLLKDFRAPKYATISIELIKLFVKNGVRGDYGTFKNQMNIVNIQNLHFWISEGLKSEKYKLAQNEFNLILQKESMPEMSEAQKIMFSKESCKRAFETYKKTKEIPFSAFSYYNIINDLIGVEYKGLKTLITDLEVRKQITNEVREKYTKKLLSEKKRYDKTGDLTISHGIMDAIASDFKTGESLNNLIKAEFLKYYFDKLISEQKELEF